MTKIARDFTLQTDANEPVTLVDFKAGIEDASRGVITFLDWVVCVIDPTLAGVRAAATMRTLLEQVHEGRMPATRHLQSLAVVKLTEDSYRTARTKGAVYVLNKVPDVESEHPLWQLQLLPSFMNSGLRASGTRYWRQPGMGNSGRERPMTIA